MVKQKKCDIGKTLDFYLIDADAKITGPQKEYICKFSVDFKVFLIWVNISLFSVMIKAER